MAVQQELEMEKQLIEQLETLGYEYISIRNDADLKANFKKQVEKHNGIKLSTGQFENLLLELQKGDEFDKAKRLRGKVQIQKENGDFFHIDLINTKAWCKNEFQVTRQVSQKEGFINTRYDVTLLINGLPLGQIELKRVGLGLRSAFDQIVDYKKQGAYRSLSGLYDYIQLFITSNGVDTVYFANNKKLNAKFCFPWADKNNEPIKRLTAFAETFLQKCHFSKMICQYMVFHETTRQMMVLRPYQYYAVEAIIDKIKNQGGNGYVWHTTGSGKTLTSFKSSQITSNLPGINKVLFVVDRRDLDYQTSMEFNNFSKNSVDNTTDTNKLVQQLEDPNTKLIVTTIQKLNTAITKKRYKKRLEAIRDGRMVFYFDECHRSQFGKTHQNICEYFTNFQMFGFTGTPIFSENVTKNDFGKRTTKDLFGQALHRYLITDAIRDGNVLRFSVEYLKTVKNNTELPDADLEGNKEVLCSPDRMNAVVDHIVKIHNKKTFSRKYTAIFAVSDVEMLLDYYKIINQKKLEGDHDLRVATIFSCSGQEEKEVKTGQIETDLPDLEGSGVSPARVSQLQSCISDYNGMFGTSYDARDNKSFYEYYQDVSRRVREGEVDILLVVNMFLTGFDSKKLNTLYVDKNLKHHGLIQAYSRTNRVFDAQKDHGNICCFRNLKDATDEALAIFANKYSKESAVEDVVNTVIMAPYEDLKLEFTQKVEELKQLTPTVDSVDKLKGEAQQAAFAEKFKEVNRALNTMKSYAEFEDDMESGELGTNEKELAGYQSKYLDLYDQIQSRKEATDYEDTGSILDELDFEIDLLKRDDIDVDYILGLIAKLQDEKDPDKNLNKRDQLMGIVKSLPQFADKKELLDEFINTLDEDDFDGVKDKEAKIKELFFKFVDGKADFALDMICVKENLDEKAFKKLFHSSFASKKELQSDDIEKTMKSKPSIFERDNIMTRIKRRIAKHIKIYYENLN